ncbi:MAG: hypothetical protein LWX83_10590, partial [Anaerolineae bacterium]|nr:hypothetical protein [Anaerolineae bacterium]
IIQVLGHEVRPITQSEFDSLKSEKLQTWLTDAKTAATITKTDNFAQYIPTEPALAEDEIIFPGN